MVPEERCAAPDAAFRWRLYKARQADWASVERRAGQFTRVEVVDAQSEKVYAVAMAPYRGQLPMATSA